MKGLWERQMTEEKQGWWWAELMVMMSGEGFSD